MRYYSIVLLILVIVSGCQNSQVTERNGLTSTDHKSLSFATGFRIDDYDSFRILSVFDPWQKSEGITFQYMLGKDPEGVPDSLDHLPFIKVPVRKVIAFSTTHIAFIDTLAGTGSIAGVSGIRNVYNDNLRENIQNGIVRDVGYDQGVNYELLIDLEPDIIFMYGVESSIGATISKLKDLQLVPVMCGEYLEAYPLGKAEWIKFFGEFYDMRETADHIYSGIDSAYREIQEKTSRLTERPAILSGLPWKNTWYLPGGRSFAARLIDDAGGNYLWSDNKSKEALPYDLESVYMKAIEADIWINPGDASSLEMICDSDERFRNLPVLKAGKVFNNNLSINPYGGNDYWESGALRPDLIVADLFAIFHPGQNSDHTFTYYRKLK